MDFDAEEDLDEDVSQFANDLEQANLNMNPDEQEE